MSDESKQIMSDIQREIESASPTLALSPTTIALSVQRRLMNGAIVPRAIEYASLEHLKQMSRTALARNYDADRGEDSVSYQGEMFSGELQERYPVPHVRGQAPVYKPRDQLTAKEIAFNLESLRKSAAARLKHADALQAWADSRMHV